MTGVMGGAICKLQESLRGQHQSQAAQLGFMVPALRSGARQRICTLGMCLETQSMTVPGVSSESRLKEHTRPTEVHPKQNSLGSIQPEGDLKRVCVREYHVLLAGGWRWLFIGTGEPGKLIQILQSFQGLTCERIMTGSLSVSDGSSCQGSDQSPWHASDRSRPWKREKNFSEIVFSRDESAE